MRTLLLILLVSTLVPGLSSLSQAADRDQKSTVHDNPKLDQKLSKEFNVTESRIDTLRGQKLGYGEIRHVLTIAKQMSGGIDDTNIHKIMEMRDNHEGWGRIGQALGVKLHIRENERAEIRENINAEPHENGHTESPVFNSSAGL
ncbi:MAG: hypothetical protein KGJ11_10025, partial [Candidatus Omnitrophica bacterium]|nr:hypothetical protein [Candidatus Omnitrophota bacterium]